MRRPSMLQTRASSADSGRHPAVVKGVSKNKTSVIVQPTTPRAAVVAVPQEPRREPLWLRFRKVTWILTCLALWTWLSIQQVVRDKQFLLKHQDSNENPVWLVLLLATTKLGVASICYGFLWLVRLRPVPKARHQTELVTFALLGLVALFNALGVVCLLQALYSGTATLTNIAKSSQPVVSLVVSWTASLILPSSHAAATKKQTSWMKRIVQILFLSMIVGGVAYACMELTGGTVATFLNDTSLQTCLAAVVLSSICFALRSVLSRRQSLQYLYRKYGPGNVFGAVAVYSFFWMCLTIGLFVALMPLSKEFLQMQDFSSNEGLAQNLHAELIYLGLWYYLTVEVAIWLVRTVDSGVWNTASDIIRRTAALVVCSDMLDEMCCAQNVFVGYAVAIVGHLMYAYSYYMSITSPPPGTPSRRKNT